MLNTEKDYTRVNMSKSESRFYHMPGKGIFNRLNNLQEALEARNKGGYVWMDLFQPDKELLTLLAEPLDLHQLSIEDCLDEQEIPKMDDYPNHSFIIFNSFSYDNKALKIGELDVFIGDHFLITSRQEEFGDLKVFQEIEKYFTRGYGDILQGPAYLLHFILDQIEDYKFVVIEELEEDLNVAEEKILEDLTTFDPAALLNLRRDLLAVRKSLFHEREVLVKICRLDCPFISKKAIYYYRDIYDHLSKFFELTESSRDLVSSLMEMYLSMLNNQMAKTANNTNSTVRRLTYITTIFMPLSLLAGIGGMSEYSMMTGSQNWRLSYPMFLAAMAILGIANYALLLWWDRKRKSQNKPEDD
jgi:magnesium transporter